MGSGEMAEKKKSPREVLAALRKEHNGPDRSIIGTLDEFEKVSGYSTGNISLDFLTGAGGYPKGRIVEQHGVFSSGKTTSALQAMAVEQRRIIEAGEERYMMFLDYERSIDPVYCAKLGLDTDHESFIYVRPKNFEHGANIFRHMLDTGAVSIAVFDSVAAMVSEKEQQADTGKANVADRAKMMHQFLRQITAPCEEYGTTAIFLNHTMEKVDTSPMGQRMAAQGIKVMTQPGGTALPFYASLRIEFKKTKKVKSSAHDAITDETDKMVTAQDIQATVIKNKVGAAFGTVALRVRFGKGFSQPYSVLAILKAHKAIKVQGAWHYFEGVASPQESGEKVGFQGEDAALTAIEKDAEWLSRLEAIASDHLASYGVEKVDSDLYDSNGQIKAQEPTQTPQSVEDAQMLWEDPDGNVVNTQTGEVQ